MQNVYGILPGIVYLNAAYHISVTPILDQRLETCGGFSIEGGIGLFAERRFEDKREAINPKKKYASTLFHFPSSTSLFSSNPIHRWSFDSVSSPVSHDNSCFSSLIPTCLQLCSVITRNKYITCSMDINITVCV